MLCVNHLLLQRKWKMFTCELEENMSEMLHPQYVLSID